MEFLLLTSFASSMNCKMLRTAVTSWWHQTVPQGTLCLLRRVTTGHSIVWFAGLTASMWICISIIIIIIQPHQENSYCRLWPLTVVPLMGSSSRLWWLHISFGAAPLRGLCVSGTPSIPFHSVRVKHHRGGGGYQYSWGGGGIRGDEVQKYLLGIQVLQRGVHGNVNEVAGEGCIHLTLDVSALIDDLVP